MNRYRNYMDRIVPPAGLREKILAGGRPRRRLHPALTVGGLAASPLNVWLRARAGLPRTGLVFYTKFFVIVFAVGFLCAFLRPLFIQQKKAEE